MSSIHQPHLPYDTLHPYTERRLETAAGKPASGPRIFGAYLIGSRQDAHRRRDGRPAITASRRADIVFSLRDVGLVVLGLSSIPAHVASLPSPSTTYMCAWSVQRSAGNFAFSSISTCAGAAWRLLSEFGFRGGYMTWAPLAEETPSGHMTPPGGSACTLPFTGALCLAHGAFVIGPFEHHVLPADRSGYALDLAVGAGSPARAPTPVWRMPRVRLRESRTARKAGPRKKGSSSQHQYHFGCF